ncbi:MAG: histidine kinase [Ideonella sp.]|nr:histidine kinase [Ideonella sp.]
MLHLEDSELDHQLAMAHLRPRQAWRWSCERVDTEAGLQRRPGQPWDVILSGLQHARFFRLEGAWSMRKREPGVSSPFILVSGEIGEDVAVAAMRNGASDYLLKSNLARLAPARGARYRGRRDASAPAASADRAAGGSRQRLSELAQHLQTSVEMERAAIAREIHDDVGGSLSALKFELAWLARNAASTPEVKQRLDSAMETVTHALEASQRIMHNLRPAILEQGLVAALQWMANRFERRTGISCAFRTSHDSPQLPPGVPLVAYRTAQEALTNVTKHAQATRVSIDLSVAQGVMSLEVSDNGRGLSDTDLAKARSFGIRGLHERASTVGGWVDLSSGTAGTTLILSIPLDAGAAAAVDHDGLLDDLPHDPSSWGDV